MRIAVATNDGKTVASHAGCARAFHIYDVDESLKLTRLEERLNPHRDFVRERHAGGEEHGGSCHEEGSRGEFHGTSAHGRGHEILFKAIFDCDVLLAGGMGRRLAQEAATRGIRPVVTEEEDIIKALEAFVQGRPGGRDFCQGRGNS